MKCLAWIMIPLVSGAMIVRCSSAAPGQKESAGSSQPLSPWITPLVDHHTHIWSERAAALLAVPRLPVIRLPHELDHLLREKERRSREATVAALKDLYTEDALLLEPSRLNWLRGLAALKYLAEGTMTHTLVPNAYAMDGAVGYITGTIVATKGATHRPVSNFHYSLKKGADGKWRIAVETFTEKGPLVAEAATAERLIAELNVAGIRRAAVLSVAYWFGKPLRDPPVEDEYAKVRAENDWVADQTARYPDRLAAFFSFNPLKDYATDELARCGKDRRFKGLKLHFGNSGVDVRNPEHVGRLRRVFRAANERRLPIIVHLWVMEGYGPAHSEAFLKDIAPSAPDVPIQIAHLAATGPGYHSDDALEVYAKAAVARDERMRNIYFDVSGMVLRETAPDTLTLVAKRLRQLGLQRILFGSDRGGTFNEPPDAAWAAFRRLPLTDDEFRTVAENGAPYLR